MIEKINGFPARMRFTPVPNFFFSTLLPQINDMTELKTTLHIMAALYQKKGYPRFVSFSELQANKSLMGSFKEATEPPDKVLRNAIEMAARRGTILRVALDREDISEDIYLLNTESDRQTAAKIQSGELSLPGLKASQQPYTELAEQPDIFTLYEQNIGMLTPIIAEELSEAERLYPVDWIRDAVREAVSRNKRNWKYIAAILERWSAEGRNDGTYQRDSTQKADPDKYIKGKYGHMVRR